MRLDSVEKDAKEQVVPPVAVMGVDADASRLA